MPTNSPAKTFEDCLAQVKVIPAVPRGWKDERERYRFNVTREWLQQLQEAYPSIKHPVDWDLTKVQAQTDGFYNCLWRRCKEHIERAKDKTHWVCDVLLVNLSRNAAMMVYSGFVVEDVGRLEFHGDQCLLNDCESAVVLYHNGRWVNDELAKIWNGIYMSKWKGGWNRSGKASKLIYRRVCTHVTNSKLGCAESRKSNFYLSHPSRDSHCIFHERRLCYFEELTFVCAVGYNPRAASTKYIHEEKDGLFIYPTAALKSLGHVNGQTQKNEKKCLMTEYSQETTVQLAMKPQEVVSTSWGFESFLLSKRKRKRTAEEFISEEV